MYVGHGALQGKTLIILYLPICSSLKKAFSLRAIMKTLLYPPPPLQLLLLLLSYIVTFEYASAVASVKEDFANAKGDANYFFHTNSIQKGDKYMIDKKKQWKMANFKLGSKEFPDTWGYAHPQDHLPLNHKGYNEDVVRLCGEDLKNGANNERTFTVPMHTYDKYGTANYYKNTPEFSDWKGVDLIPESKDYYEKGSPYVRGGLNFTGHTDIMGNEEIMMQRCKVPRDDGKPGGWVVDRVGPFYATGGYDWWQIGWSNVGGFQGILDEHPDGIDVDIKAMVPVTEDGRRVGHPPIHIHHIHVVPRMGVRPRNKIRQGCLHTHIIGATVTEKNCYNSSLIMEQHGDYQCNVEDDGIDCLTTIENRRIREAVDIEGELNDVRPPGSEKIKFYYQAGFRWSPIQPEVRAVSQTTIMAPAKRDPDDQLSRTITFVTPTHAEHMLWYTGRAWATGELLRNKLHAHNMVFESSEFFLGTPKDLGLDQPRLWPEKSYVPLKTKDLGFANNDEFRDWLFGNLEDAQVKYDKNCELRENPSDEACGRPRPRLVCAALHDSEDFIWEGEEYSFDRRPKTWCEPWKFREGDAFTVTGFSRHLTRPNKPDTPGKIPANIPGHISWHMWWYHDSWDHSYFNRIVCNQGGIFFDSHRDMGFAKILGIYAAVVTTGGYPRSNAPVFIYGYSIITILSTIVIASICGVYKLVSSHYISAKKD